MPLQNSTFLSVIDRFQKLEVFAIEYTNIANFVEDIEYDSVADDPDVERDLLVGKHLLEVGRLRNLRSLSLLEMFGTKEFLTN